MKPQTKIRLSLLGVALLTVIAGLVDYPNGPDWNFGDTPKEIKVHLGLDIQGGTSLLYDADVSNIPEADRTQSMEGVKDVIEQRINAFGVGEPNIQTSIEGEEHRLLVELPGVTDITEAINRIGATPLLEFKTEGEPPEYTEEEKEAIRARNEEQRVKAEELLAQAREEGADFAAIAEENSEDVGSAADGGSLGEFEEGVMVAEFNDVVFNKATAGEVYPELVQTDFGYHIILVEELRETEQVLEEPAEEEADSSDVSSDEERDDASEESSSEQETTEAEETVETVRTATARHILLRTESEERQLFGPYYEDTGLTGEQLDRADVVFDPNTGLPTVSLTFNRDGRELFGQLTREHINETIAIYLDGGIISNPVVNDEITTGEAVISGGFTLAEAQELAQRLNAGALPVPIELISQQNVGPTLGQTSIERSVFAGIVGLVLLVFFLVGYYRWPGVVASFALGLYFLFVLALFKLIPVTLTLAGIAGFILSVGMAVDANVLIFERMKEELRSGKPLKRSITEGFTRAWSSIRDSNLSSLITCLILYWFGSSLIRGFAITLALGILVSMFSAVVITRTLLLATPLKSPKWYGVKGANKKN